MYLHHCMSRFDIPCNGINKSQITILGNIILIVGLATNYIDIDVPLYNKFIVVFI